MKHTIKMLVSFVLIYAGNFGKVFKGTLECENGNTSSVAVKTLHGEYDYM